jgi:hypothetical protein
MAATITLEQHTQRGLNAILGCNLKDDGVIGTFSTAQIANFITLMKRIYREKNYIWEPHYNFGAFRMSDVLDNQFSDWGFIIIGDTNAKLFPMSTKPGLMYMQQKDTLGGVWVEGQYLDTLSLENSGWSGMPFLMQRKPVKFYRDLDLDNVIDRGTVHSDSQSALVGFYIHSYYNTITKWFWDVAMVSIKNATGRVSALSKGCQVFMASVWKQVLPWVEVMVKAKINRRVTYTLIHIKDKNL